VSSCHGSGATSAGASDGCRKRVCRARAHQRLSRRRSRTSSAWRRDAACSKSLPPACSSSECSRPTAKR
jgi:hypothetical protein